MILNFRKNLPWSTIIVRNVSHNSKSSDQKYLDFAIQIVKYSGHFIRERLTMKKIVQEKKLKYDVVTDTDLEIEAYLIKKLENEFPTHKIISEERMFMEKGKVDLTNDPTWIIDPIDGTLNFVHGFPQACVSLGFFKDKEPYIGVAYNPILHQLYTARKRHGAYLNGSPISVSTHKELNKSFIMMGMGHKGDREKHKIHTDNYRTLIPQIHGVRNLGSAVLNMAMVARGGCDAYYSVGIHIWDIAVGELLITEAGGVVVDPSGGPFDRLARRVLCAGTSELAQILAKNLIQYYPKRDDA